MDIIEAIARAVIVAREMVAVQAIKINQHHQEGVLHTTIWQE